MELYPVIFPTQTVVKVAGIIQGVGSGAGKDTKDDGRCAVTWTLKPLKKGITGLITKDIQFPLDPKIDIEIENKNWDDSLCSFGGPLLSDVLSGD